MWEEGFDELKESTKHALASAWNLRDWLYRCKDCAIAKGDSELADTFDLMWYSLNWIIVTLEKLERK